MVNAIRNVKDVVKHFFLKRFMILTVVVNVSDVEIQTLMAAINLNSLKACVGKNVPYAVRKKI